MGGRKIGTDKLPVLRPMLAVSSAPFDSREHLFEIKWDGYRALAYLDGDTAIMSRNLFNLGDRFPELGGLHNRVKNRPAIIDGEIVVFEKGRPSFAGIQFRGKIAGAGTAKEASIRNPAVFIAFDVLYSGGAPVMELPLKERKEILAQIIIAGDRLQLSQFIFNGGIDFFNACAGEGLEGVVAKALDSPYLPGRRSAYWKKFRHTREADLVICGYQPGRGSRSLGSLVLGGMKGGRLVYQGKVGTGFSTGEASLLLETLRKIEIPEPVMDIPSPEKKQTRWVSPLLVCSVNYLTTTAEGYLRHPVFRGIRRDKSPRECPEAVRQQ